MAPGRICIRFGLHSPAEGNCPLRHCQAVDLAGSRITSGRIIDDDMERHRDDSHRNQSNNQELLHGNTERKGQRPESAAPDPEFVSERNGWLPFAAPFRQDHCQFFEKQFDGPSFGEFFFAGT